MTLISAVLGLVLIVAAAPKLRAAAAFGSAIEAYRLVPRAVARVLGRVLPWVELAVGTSLVTGPLFTTAPRTPAADVTVAASGVAALMFIAFTAALGINLMRGRTELSCGCFAFGAVDESAERISWFHAGRAAVLAVAAAACVLVGPGVASLADRMVQLVVAAVIVASGVVVAEMRTLAAPGRSELDSVLRRAELTLSEVER